MVKVYVRRISIEEGKLLARRRKQQTEIIYKINQLSSLSNLSDEQALELNQMQTNLDHLYIDKAKGAFIHSRAK